MRASLARPDERVGQRVHNKLRAFSKQLAHPKPHLCSRGASSGSSASLEISAADSNVR